MKSGKKTERLPAAERADVERAPRARLVRVGVASDPLAPPSIFDLQGLDRVVLGRVEGEQTSPDLITSDDRWMSRAHAAVERAEDGWRVADLGSANGTLVRGQRTSTTTLSDGDVIETGSTFWVFRNDLVEGALPRTVRSDNFGTLVPSFAATVERAERVASSRIPIVIEGATGTGKELLARHIHEYSGRSGPFVAINTAAVQSNLVASELFGVERGAHSMADRSRAGQIRTAQNGTLLLDEIGDMPLEVQVTLLRVLQENEVLPVGGDRPVSVDVRFLCATHQDLSERVNEGRFRADLLARLTGTTLMLPPLNERREDIGLLIGRFLRASDAASYSLTPTAYRALMVYDWPLNVRQLERTVQAAVALSDDDRLELAHLPEDVRSYQPNPAARPTIDEPDRRRELVRLLSAHRGNVSAVARSMGYSRMQVHRWLKQLRRQSGRLPKRRRVIIVADGVGSIFFASSSDSNHALGRLNPV